MVIDCLYFYLKLVSRRSWPTEPKTSRALQSTGEWHLGFHKVRGEALRTRGRPHPTMKRNASKCEWSIIYEGKTCSNHHVFLFGSNTTRRKGGGAFSHEKNPQMTMFGVFQPVWMQCHLGPILFLPKCVSKMCPNLGPDPPFIANNYCKH